MSSGRLRDGPVRSLLPGWLPLALRLSSLGSSATQQAKLRRRQSTAYSCTDYHGAAPGTEAQRLLAQLVTQETSPAIAALAAHGWRLGKASVIMPSCRKTLEGMAARMLRAPHYRFTPLLPCAGHEPNWTRDRQDAD